MPQSETYVEISIQRICIRQYANSTIWKKGIFKNIYIIRDEKEDFISQKKKTRILPKYTRKSV